VTLRDHEMGDIQVAAEYIVNVLRSMHARSGGKVEYVGYSQGGMIGRWALKYWPDTRAMVDDYVGIDPSNHGTLDANVACMRWVPGTDADQAFAALAADAEEASAFGIRIRVCSLDALRRMKRAAGRPQDLLDLAALDDTDRVS
jgi:pimeloyl-ACP methyl ester carboxylesterase